MAQFVAVVGELRPQVVHLHDFFDPRMASDIRRLAPVVWSVHNFVGCTSGYKYFRQPGDECTRQHGPGCVPHLLFKGCFHGRDPRPMPKMYAKATTFLAALREADVAVAHSRFVTRHLESNSIPRIQLVPLFSPGRVRALPLPRSHRLLFVGRITPVKGLEVLLKAMARLDIPLDICGEGWGLPRSERLATRLGLQNRVTFHGAEAPDTISRRYASTSVVVVPSLWPEPFGLVGLEAMAHGRPVVGSATGGIPEWLTDNETGFLVPPGNPRALAVAVDRLVADHTLAGRFGRRGAEVARDQFSPSHYLDAVASAYAFAHRHWKSGSR